MIGDYDTALKQYRKSLEVNKRIEDINGIATNMAQMGNLYFEQNQFEAALRQFIQAFLLFSKIGSPKTTKVKQEIARCGEKLPEARYKEILQEFKLSPEDFNQTKAG